MHFVRLTWERKPGQASQVGGQFSQQMRIVLLSPVSISGK